MNKKWKEVLETLGVLDTVVKIVRFLVGLSMAIATLQWSAIVDFLRGTPNG